MSKAKRNHWYDLVDTGIASHPKYYLTHWNGSKDYTIMVMSWDVANDRSNGWFPLAEFDTIRGARLYMGYMIAVWGTC